MNNIEIRGQRETLFKFQEKSDNSSHAIAVQIALEHQIRCNQLAYEKQKNKANKSKKVNNSNEVPIKKTMDKSTIRWSMKRRPVKSEKLHELLQIYKKQNKI